MNKYLNIAFVGGDLRQIQMISKFAADGCKIKTLGFEEAVFPCNISAELCQNPHECIKSADIVILPLPYNSGADTVNTAFSKTKIFINDIIRNMSGDQILFAGRADEQLKALSKLYNVHLIDYSEREEMSVLNSIPTAEGAIGIAMSETSRTIHGSRCLVLGYGRISKILSKDLDLLGAKVSTAARKYSDLAWIRAAGLEPIPFKDLEAYIGNYDIIFNTVPAPVLDFKMLSKIPDGTLIIDLASRPGGVDFETAASLNKKVIWALSLPGKAAPDTAGDIIKDTIYNILEELGV